MSLLVAGSAVAGPRSTVSRNSNLYGVPGLIDLPTAEVAPDSEFTFTYGRIGNMGMRGTLTFQITPRLSGSFRYSRLRGFDPRPTVDDYFDRSFDLRFRLLDETKYLPAVSVGLNDFIGTGVFSGEYIVATKSIGEKLRITGGVGWGRLGGPGAIGRRFSFSGVGQGGTLNFRNMFRGPKAPFSGVSYQLNDKITLKAEYSSDPYDLEVGAGVFNRRSPFNFGVDYEVFPGMNLGLYSLYGSGIGVTLRLSGNPRDPAADSGLERAPVSVRPRPPRNADPEGWDGSWSDDRSAIAQIEKYLGEALAKDGQRLEALAVTSTRAELRIANISYPATPEAVGRAARMMSRTLPYSVETFVITIVKNGVPVTSFTMKRSDIEALEHAPAHEMFERVTISDAAGPKPSGLVAAQGAYPRYSWNLAPYLSVGLFDPQQPASADFGLRLAASYHPLPGVVLSGAVRKRAWSNLSTQISNSKVPHHVRSEIGQYTQAGDPAIEHLTAAWYARPGRSLYSRVTVGYLEPMFAGVSGELLWKPTDSRLGLGIEVNYVRQRAFNQLFGFFRDAAHPNGYNVLTGHASAYYDFDNGFTGQLDVGRYLAGDYGATLSVNRVFSNGWRVGAYATVTDIPAVQFGEGSFDKGITVTIPLGWALGTPSKAEGGMLLRSLSRDGGARLDVNGRLFEWIEDAHEDELARRWGRFWR